MDTYAKVLLVAIPVFLGLMVVEALYSWWKGTISYNGMDTISSLSSGTTNTLKSVLNLSVVVISYSWFVGKVAVVDIKVTWVVWVLSFLAIDFASYWSHRLNHSINYFWNRHIVHHSSEEFNLACALRQPISNIIGYGFIFLLPAALLGLPAKIIAVIAPIHLFMQFWYHTKHIPKLGWLEYIIVTPSQHRVHHAINDIYLDKNLSAIFCIWDRIFGTFQEELEDVPCVYGVKKSVQTWNPIKINWIHFWQLCKDAWRTENWNSKAKIWLMPTGWRPADVATKYPLNYETDPYKQEKYRPASSAALQVWSWAQFLFTITLMIHMMVNLADIGFPLLFLYGGFLFMLVYAYTSLMDHEGMALWFTAITSIFGLSIIYFSGGWFNLEETFTWGPTILGIYFVASTFIVLFFTRNEVTTIKRSEFQA